MYSTPPAGTPIEALTTPAPLIDETVMAANIARVQAYMNKTGLKFRPHVKTHKIPEIARAQIDAGATGINCQKISEAETFADAGFDDILITFNILGTEKIARLKALNAAVTLSVVADSVETVDGLARAFDATRPLTVLVECDTGAKRCGVQSPEAALALAKHIANKEGLRFGGLLTYPNASGEAAGEAFFSAAKQLLAAGNLLCPVLSYGGSPSLYSAHLVPSATEFRAGTYVYCDRALIRAGHCTAADCAMTVLATVVSRPTEDRMVLDAGSKTLTSDLLGFDDYGLIVGLPGARITALSEEHAVVTLSASDAHRPTIGDKVRIIPNHTCVVSNLFDTMLFHRDGRLTQALPVAARGQVW